MIEKYLLLVLALREAFLGLLVFLHLDGLSSLPLLPIKGMPPLPLHFLDIRDIVGKCKSVGVKDVEISSEGVSGGTGGGCGTLIGDTGW